MALNLGKDLVRAVVRGTVHGDEVRVPGKGVMRFVCADAAKVGGKGGKPDVVFLAALVGVGEEKMLVALSVIAGMKEGATLLMRSAAGLRKLVYEEVLDGEVVRRAREAGTPVRVVSASVACCLMLRLIFLLRSWSFTPRTRSSTASSSSSERKDLGSNDD